MQNGSHCKGTNRQVQSVQPGPHFTGTPAPDMFKFVHSVAQTVNKQTVGILVIWSFKLHMKKLPYGRFEKNRNCHWFQGKLGLSLCQNYSLIGCWILLKLSYFIFFSKRVLLSLWIVGVEELPWDPRKYHLPQRWVVECYIKKPEIARSNFNGLNFLQQNLFTSLRKRKTLMPILLTSSN